MTNSYQKWQKEVLDEIKDQDYIIKATLPNGISSPHSIRIKGIVETLRGRCLISIESILEIARSEDNIRQTLFDFYIIIDRRKWFRIKGKANRAKFRNDLLHIIHTIKE